MTTPIKTPVPTAKPADKTAPAKPAKVAAPALDFSKLTVETADAPRTQRPGKASGPNPFDKHIADSWDAKVVMRKLKGGVNVYIGAGRAVTVPTAQVTYVQNLIRRAAASAGLGSAIALSEGPVRTATGAVIPAGQTQIRFAAKSRKQSRKGQDTATAQVPAQTTKDNATK